MLDLLGKIGEFKLQMEQTKKQFELLTLEAEAGNGKVRVVADGNHQINRN